LAEKKLLDYFIPKGKVEPESENNGWKGYSSPDDCKAPLKGWKSAPIRLVLVDTIHGNDYFLHGCRPAAAEVPLLTCSGSYINARQL
jgi:hypothetical protein